MAQWIDLDTPAGPVRAWRADPGGPPRGGLVVIQEIFGVNAHIRAVAERFAEAGYAVLAPALFDPVEPGVELGYDQSAAARGVELRNAVGFDRASEIVGAAAHRLQDEGLRTGAVGFCWGGSLAFLANTRHGLPAVSYYGARTLPFLGEPARAPIAFHFGRHDGSIPPEAIEQHRQALPNAPIYLYDAGHGFNCELRADYDADSAALAWRRTLDFLADNLK
ncbi:dienelactone hydrolase family protein [Lysobacter sp. BMK333-48F3]|uniref:dienelactone hydrolase family protein n=1 Tax=Lysobacter sp. BMK333-48F3 TaxID=2867962 RepID=UPI001C8B7204|nr:dienelactone hydrolase family protein [Lysobacter sp. BMK333-48F3]MBX9403636.1 dienelactone hydrolase family protein [Lysobacter sp. BMK333-48F3]